MIAMVAALASAQVPHDCLPKLRSANRPEMAFERTSSGYPIRVHWNRPGDEELAMEILAYAEVAWEAQVTQMGFKAPVFPDANGDSILDYYLSDAGYGSAYAAVDRWEDSEPGDGYNGASAYMVVDFNLPLEWVPTYVAHEFNHVIQWGYDFTELTLPIWEGTATAAQEWTLPGEGYWDNDVDSYQMAPAFPALVGDSYVTYYEFGTAPFYEYGSALFVMFLDEKYGNGDGALGVQLWENTANEGFDQEPDAVDAFAMTAGLELPEALNELAVVRFLVADDWDERGLANAESWTSREKVPADEFAGADLPLSTEPSFPPMITGQAFFDVDLDGFVAEVGVEEEAFLQVSASSATALESAVVVLWWHEDGSVGHDGAWGGTPAVEVPLEGLTRVAVGLTNLGPVAWDGDDEAYLPGDQAVSMGVVGREVEATVDEPLPPDTGDTGSAQATTDGPDPGEGDDEKAGGCGCASTSSSGWSFSWLSRRR